jgi:hypothetical protein
MHPTLPGRSRSQRSDHRTSQAQSHERGSENGAETACVLYSLLATCKLHGVNPFEYLRDVIVRVASHPARDVLELSPKAWKQKLQDLDAARSAPTPAG